MTTVADIAKTAFDAVAAQITDAIYSAILTDGTSTYTGRVVFGGEDAPSGFPMATPSDKLRPAYLEGFGTVPASGWTITADGKTHFIMSERDIVEAGGLIVANVIEESDLLWLSVDIEAKTRTDNGAGGHTEAWAAIAGGSGLSAGMWSMSGEQGYGADRVEATSEWRAVLPYLDGVTEACRVKFGGRAYNIAFVDNSQKRGAWLVLDLQEGVPA
jgi:SPP1 family predicted phage head-tail adaptor